LPAYTPYGNLSLKGSKIVQRLDAVNLEIERVFTSHADALRAARAGEILITPSPFDHLFYAEQVVYWLRKTADEIIALACVLEGHQRTGKWPAKIEPDCIAGLLEASCAPRIEALFAPFRDFLKMLNEVSNAFKHSFMGTEIDFVGAEYPVLYALGLQRNDTAKQPILYSVTFAAVISDFSIFYRDSMKGLQAWAPPHLSNKDLPRPVASVSVWPAMPFGA
jgi:hypothetical protein